jgi:predicted amidohydrolase YtcJ
MRIPDFALALAVACALSLPAFADDSAPADLVISNARIYTADATQPMAQALAVRAGRLVYVGDDKGVRSLIGKDTHVERLNGQLLLPGLVDSHIHPTDIVQFDKCDLDNRQVTLAELARFVRGCIERYHTAPGEWVSVRQWNYSNGNQPDAALQTLRAALDAGSTVNPVHLLGNDGHHAAFNSLALKGTRNPAGTVVGLSAATLATDFAAVREFVGVDASGEPDGNVNETLQYAVDGPDEYAQEKEDFAALMQRPERVTERLNSVGITAVLDAAVPPRNVAFYDALLKSGHLTVRARLAQFYDPELFRGGDGVIDWPRLVSGAEAVRAHFAEQPLVRADIVKLFADGGIEGNPLATPPSLPNGALLHPLLQPRFRRDAAGHLQLDGYVDTGSAACRTVRRDHGTYTTPAAIAEFTAAHGFHPEQCMLSSGRLYHSREDIFEFVRRFHLDGFALHIHVIGDRAARTAIDAIEAARALDGIDLGRDGLAHLQLSSPEDVARIGRDHLHVAFTYAWAYQEREYDLTVIPFLQHVTGSSLAALHPPGSFYDANAYPVRAVLEAGGVPVGGSDAPVDTYDPRPFINMADAVTRRFGNLPPLNKSQALTIREAIDSYTISGAKFLGWGTETGSLEPGKSADFIILDRDILALADAGQPEKIQKTRVLETWFMGQRVYAAPRVAVRKDKH